MQQAVVYGVITGAVYGFVAIGLVLIYKSSGVFNFAQGEFGTVAVYFLYLAKTGWHLPYPIALLVALGVAVVMGLLTERLIVRPLFDAPRVTLLVATAGVALVSIGTQVWLGEAKPRTIAPILTEPNRITVLGVFVSDQRLLVIGVLLAVAAVLAWFFSRTSLGLAILAASQEPTATDLVGISVKRLSSFTWALAALLGRLAGVLSAPVQGFFTPGQLTLGQGGLIPGFTAAVIGGMTSLPGAFAGGIIVGIAQSMAGSVSWLNALRGSQAVVVFSLLLLVLTVRPQGLFGSRA